MDPVYNYSHVAGSLNSLLSYQISPSSFVLAASSSQVAGPSGTPRRAARATVTVPVYRYSGQSPVFQLPVPSWSVSRPRWTRRSFNHFSLTHLSFTHQSHFSSLLPVFCFLFDHGSRSVPCPRRAGPSWRRLAHPHSEQRQASSACQYLPRCLVNGIERNSESSNRPHCTLASFAMPLAPPPSSSAYSLPWLAARASSVREWSLFGVFVG